MIGQYKRDLTVVRYRAEWKALFEEEQERLHRAMGAEALRIEHIGSTSVPGLAAKPIIDIMVAVASLARAEELAATLAASGYEYRPNDTIDGRLFFAKESAREIRTHHLSLTPENSAFWRNHLTFRDVLRGHDELAAEYVALKRQIAQDYARTHELDRDAKTDFVRRVLELAGKGNG